MEKTPEQVLFESFCNQYQSFTSFINSLPLAENLKNIMMMNLDTAFLWGKEAFTIMKLNPPPAPIASCADANAPIAPAEPLGEVA